MVRSKFRGQEIEINNLRNEMEELKRMINKKDEDVEEKFRDFRRTVNVMMDEQDAARAHLTDTFRAYTEDAIECAQSGLALALVKNNQDTKTAIMKVANVMDVRVGTWNGPWSQPPHFWEKFTALQLQI